jgi:hypothetical protein
MRFVTQDDVLLIQLEGMERVWALKLRLEVPRLAVLEVDYDTQRPAMQDFWGYLRIPGTSVPWRFLAGTFWRGKEREFWFVRMRHPGVMLVELKPDTFPYRRLRISCDPETAQAVADWWHHGKKGQT